MSCHILNSPPSCNAFITPTPSILDLRMLNICSIGLIDLLFGIEPNVSTNSAHYGRPRGTIFTRDLLPCLVKVNPYHLLGGRAVDRSSQLSLTFFDAAGMWDIHLYTSGSNEGTTVVNKAPFLSPSTTVNRMIVHSLM